MGHSRGDIRRICSRDLLEIAAHLLVGVVPPQGHGPNGTGMLPLILFREKAQP